MDTTCPFCGALSSFAIADAMTWQCGSESCSFDGPDAWQSPECKLRVAKDENERLKELESAAIAFGEADILLDRSEKDWPEDLCETHCRAYEKLKQTCQDMARRQHESGGR